MVAAPIFLASLALHLGVVGITSLSALLLFTANRRQPWNRFLAFFLAAVALNFLASAASFWLGIMANAGVIDAATADRGIMHAGTIGAAALILDPLLLVYFALLFPHRHPITKRPAAIFLLAAPTLVFFALDGFTQFASQPEKSEPLRFVFFAYMAACYAFGAGRLLHLLLRERSAIMAKQIGAVALGVIVATVSRVALVPSDLIGHTPVRALPTWSIWHFLARATILWLLFAIAWRWASRGPRRDDARRLLTIAAWPLLAFTIVWAIADVANYLAATARLPSAALGQWVSFMAGGLTYTTRWLAFGLAMYQGVVSHQIVRISAPAAATAALGFGLPVGTILIVTASVAYDAWVVGLAAAAPLAGMAALVVLVLRSLDRRSRGNSLQERSLEVYAAMVAAMPSETKTNDAMTDARERLGVSTQQHDLLLALERIGSGLPEDARYEIIGEAGHGGFASVHVAHDRQAGNKVVLKHISNRRVGGSAALGAALRELEVARRASHPNLVTIHDVVRVPDGAVVVMEHAAGDTLRHEMYNRLMPAADAIHIITQVLSGLGALHDAGLAHGDIKPENILVSDGTYKLGDFGTARGADGHPTLARSEIPEAAAGTIGYLAPEQVAGAAASAASDLYAVGLVACELIGDDPAAKAPAWTAFRRRALAHEPTQRFPSARAMAAAVQTLPVA